MKELNVITNETMTSLEISELVGNEHAKTKQSIERLITKQVIKDCPLGTLKLPSGQTAQVYNICKRDSFVVVAQLSPEFTAKLVDRWQELEESIKPMSMQELVLYSAQRLVDNEREIARIDKEQRVLQVQVNDMTNGSEIYAITAYCKLHKISIDNKEANLMGRMVTKYCKEHDLKISKVPHPLWGEVGAYPVAALNHIFEK